MRVVLLAVDNFVARAGLHKLLSAHEQLKVADSPVSPDVVVTEIGHGPCRAWERLPTRCAPVPVLAVAHPAPGLVSRALLAGITTCLTYGRFTETELLDAVLTLRPSTPPTPLCQHEVDTMDLISRGFSNDEIARVTAV